MFTEGRCCAISGRSVVVSLQHRRPRATSLIAHLSVRPRVLRRPDNKSLRRIRNRDTASILAEVEHLHRQHGYARFMFYDDELNVSKSYVERTACPILHSRSAPISGCAASSNRIVTSDQHRRCSAPDCAGCCAASRPPTSASSSILPTTTAARTRQNQRAGNRQARRMSPSNADQRRVSE